MRRIAISKQLLLLNGLSILAVVCYHAAGWGYTAMFWWTDRYRAVSVPNFDQVGTLPFYALRVTQQLAVFSVPSFLFVTGFFISYMGRSSQSDVTWKAVLARLKHVLIPYVIWTGVIFVGNALDGTTYSALEYVYQLISGRATPAYWYVSLLCQFYLLAPFLLAFAKRRGRLFLVSATVLHLGAIGLRYLALRVPDSPAVNVLIQLTPDWTFVRWTVFFAVGIFLGLRISELKALLSRLTWSSLLALALLGLFSVLEAEVLSSSTDQSWVMGPLKLSSSLYALLFIACFVRFARVPRPVASSLGYVGKRSYGIYLLHPKILELMARMVRQLSPWVLSHQFLFQPVLIITAAGGALLLMWVAAKSPASRYQRYLFG